MVQQCSQQRFPPSPITPAESDSSLAIETLSLNQPDIAACDKKLAVEERLSRAVHVLATETSALQNLTQLYSSDRFARDGFNRAIETITRRQASGGKLVVIGVGKSGHIAKKLVATFNSLAIQAVFLHPTEALHGDVGQISRRDTLLLITFSGKTPELLTLLPHLDKSLPLILLTSHTRPETCELVHHRPDTVLLPAPVHEEETTSFGVPAPTTSTTVALTVGDALAIVASHEMHSCVASVFARNHPGGAIGAALRRDQPREDVRAIMVRLDDVSLLHYPHAQGNLTGLDVLRAGYASPSGWVKLVPEHDDSGSGSGDGGVISPRRIRRMSAEDMGRLLDELRKWLVAPRSGFIPVAADTSVQRAAEWIRGLRAATATGGESGDDEGAAYGDEAIIAVMERGECVGLLEVGRLLEEA
ncbi:hypothetical protein C8A03DRAFT_35623 [Achaetomium macrosporum]|uniref:SIS domain-containing protein n=1 Tax=Achaetomium macrosporum TaxID=79813 RepID=A0AAN7C764_9PEZI|nr:hypothetical protein C8A03DRAFT_35623 [Achaetomium macrosporum]